MRPWANEQKLFSPWVQVFWIHWRCFRNFVKPRMTGLWFCRDESPTCLFWVIQNCFESVTGGHPESGYYFGLLGVTDPFIQTEKYELVKKLLSKPHLDFHIAPIKRIKRKNNHHMLWTLRAVNMKRHEASRRSHCFCTVTHLQWECVGEKPSMCVSNENHWW